MSVRTRPASCVAARGHRALGIAGVETTESAWSFRPPRSKPERGVQIDLLIDRKDGCINLCEMKYADAPFTIDKAYAEQLRRKTAVFRQTTGTRKAVFLTLVTTFGLEENPWVRELVAKSLTLDDLF